MNTVGTLTIEMAANIVRLQQDMDKAKKTVDNAMGSVEKSIDRVTTALGAIAGAFSVQAFTTKLVQVQREFDTLNSSLITVTGSSRNAEIEFAWIKNFAATTPFSLAEVTSAFIKMKALGLDASAEALTSYGNTASAMGKSLNDLIEAIADAATGEFERLKEFGIKASSEGDRVTLTFRGVSTTINKSSEEIVRALRAIGDENFSGGMVTRAATLDGAISTLNDTWDELFRTVNKGLFGDLLLDSVRGLTSLLSGLGSGITTLGDAIERNKTQLMIWAAIFTGGALLAALPLITAAVGALTTGVIALSAAFAANPVALAIMAVTAAAVPAVNAISAMVAENKKAESATKAVYETESQRAAFLEANASPAQAKQIQLTKEQIKEIEKQDDAYKKLIEKLREQNAEMLLEVANNGKLTTAQKQALDVMLQIQNGTLKLTEQRKLEIVEILEANIALEAEAKKREDAKKAAEEQTKAYEKVTSSISDQIQKLADGLGPLNEITAGQRAAYNVLIKYLPELNKLNDEQKIRVRQLIEELIEQEDLNQALKDGEASYGRYEGAQQRSYDQQRKTIEGIDAEIAKLRESRSQVGLTAKEIGLLEVAKIREKAASMDRASQLALEADFDAETAENYRLQAARLRELADLKEQGVHVQAAKDAAAKWKETTDELSRGLTDALMRGFESGKGFFDNLLNVLKNKFKSFVAESIIKPFMDGVAEGITALTNPLTLSIKSLVSSIMSPITGVIQSAMGSIAGSLGFPVGNAATNVIGGAGGAALGGAALGGAATTGIGQGGLAVLGEGAGAAAAGGGVLGAIGSGVAAAGSAIASGASAIAGGISSGISAAATALGPAGLAVLGAAAVASVLDGGETRQGGRYSWTRGSGLSFAGGPSGGEIQGSEIRSQVNDYVAYINSELSRLGSPAMVESLAFGLESSENGKGGTFLGGRLTTGQTFGDNVSSPTAWNFSESLSPDAAWSQFQSEVSFSVVDAVEAALGWTRGESPGAGSGGSSGLQDRDSGMIGLATGTNFVPSDMVAMLHKGEAVVPAQYNPAVGGENVVAAEIRSLRDEVVQLRFEARATAINSAKMARLQDNWDVRGLTVKTDVDQPLDTVVV